MNKRNAIAAAIIAATLTASLAIAQATPVPPSNLAAKRIAETAWVQSMLNATAIAGMQSPIVTPTSAPVEPTIAPPTAPPPTDAPPTAAPPTATPPTATPPPHGDGFDCSIPAAQRNYICGNEISQPPSVMPDLRGQVCPAWVHDRYIVAAYQDARGEWLTREADSANVAAHEVVWRTWHPNTDAATGCVFQHEHGFDWRGNSAMSGPPAFGLVGCLHWLSHAGATDNHCNEPHEGFKAFRVDAGYFDQFEGGTALHHSYYVIHFGTANAGRFSREHHSFEVWQRSANAGDPWRVHVSGMPSFGAAGNICERDHGDLNIRGDGGNRTLQQVEPSGCASNGGYEIWFAQVALYPQGARDPIASIGASSAAFGPATAFRLTSDGPPGQRTAEAVPTGEYGCKREGYHEALRYATYGNGPESLYADMHGREMQPGAFGGALQVFEQPNSGWLGPVGNSQVAFSRNRDGSVTNIFKLDESRMTPGELFGPGVHCYPSLALPN